MTNVTLTRYAATAIITLNNPKHLNALDDLMREGLASSIEQVRMDPEIKAAGAGRTSCVEHH